MRALVLPMSAYCCWPKYLQFLHVRKFVSSISEFSEVTASLDRVHNVGAKAYITDPDEYSVDHLMWVEAQSHVSREDLTRLAGPVAFKCYGRTILFAKTS